MHQGVAGPPRTRARPWRTQSRPPSTLSTTGPHTTDRRVDSSQQKSPARSSTTIARFAGTHAAPPGLRAFVPHTSTPSAIRARRARSAFEAPHTAPTSAHIRKREKTAAVHKHVLPGVSVAPTSPSGPGHSKRSSSLSASTQRYYTRTMEIDDPAVYYAPFPSSALPSPYHIALAAATSSSRAPAPAPAPATEGAKKKKKPRYRADAFLKARRCDKALKSRNPRQLRKRYKAAERAKRGW